jgi:hypothetical protein
MEQWENLALKAPSLIIGEVQVKGVVVEEG